MRISPLRFLPIHSRLSIVALAAILAAMAGGVCAAQAKPSAKDQDVLVLTNGDTLHGKLVNAIGDTVTFHSGALGDVKVKWSDIKELHAAQPFAVLSKSVKQRSPKRAAKVPAGPLDMENQQVTVHPEDRAAPPPMPVKDAAFVVDEGTLDKQIYHQPNFFAGWNGAATAGATIVEATQNQYTASGSVGLVRSVPGVTWLNPRNRTSTDFSGSFGKITEPGVAAVKTAIFHADAERDQYFSSRFFALAQVAFDHNFGQLLALQSVYGGGVGLTALQKTKQQLDVKATMQYEEQQFISSPPGTTSPSQQLVGSTFSVNYLLKLKKFNFAQEAAYIPAYNTPRAYSANETDTLSFPAYKNFSFSVGTLDSYLNDPPVSTPATRPNSFQFTMGLTYAIKSKY